MVNRKLNELIDKPIILQFRQYFERSNGMERKDTIVYGIFKGLYQDSESKVYIKVQDAHLTFSKNFTYFKDMFIGKLYVQENNRFSRIEIERKEREYSIYIVQIDKSYKELMIKVATIKENYINNVENIYPSLLEI